LTASLLITALLPTSVAIARSRKDVAGALDALEDRTLRGSWVDSRMPRSRAGVVALCPSLGPSSPDLFRFKK
jgi:hypothetical protein